MTGVGMTFALQRMWPPWCQLSTGGGLYLRNPSSENKKFWYLLRSLWQLVNHNFFHRASYARDKAVLPPAHGKVQETQVLARAHLEASVSNESTLAAGSILMPLSISPEPCHLKLPAKCVCSAEKETGMTDVVTICGKGRQTSRNDMLIKNHQKPLLWAAFAAARVCMHKTFKM